MAVLPHRIRRLAVRARAASQEEALALRKELRDGIQDVLLPALARAFDEVAGVEGIVHVPRLEIAVRISGVGEVAGVLPERILEEARARLAAVGAEEYGKWTNVTGEGAGAAAGEGRPGMAAGERSWPAAAWGAPGASGASGASGAPGAQGREAAGEGGSSSEGALAVDSPRDVRRSPPREDGETSAGSEGERRAASGSLSRGQGGDVAPGSASTGDRVPAGAGDAERGGPAGPARAEVAGRPSATLSMWIHYLETGTLPWPLAGLDPEGVRAELRAAAASDPAAALSLLQGSGGPEGLFVQLAFWFRWLQLVPEPRWPGVARAAAAAVPGDVRRSVPGDVRQSLAGDVRRSLSYGEGPALAEVVAVLAGEQAGALSRYERLRLAAAAITLVRAGPGAGAEGLAAAVLHAAGEGGGQASNTSSADAAEAGPGPSTTLAGRVPEPVAAAFRTWVGAPGGPSNGLFPAPSTGTLAGAVAGGETAAARPPVHPARPPHASALTAPVGQRVHHAGLVLLHPFLSRFLEATGVKEAGRPELLPDRLPRAAALLHALATGEDEAYEHEIDFIKVLLGLTTETPLPVSSGLVTEADREEVEALLAAVIGHWRVLGSTSVGGLRRSFLRRGGLLRGDDPGLRLQVETAPFDMLLGHLPWGIGTVKLPWMKQALFTDWPAP